MTFGQEFGAYAVMIGDGIRHLEQTSAELLKVNMGATAIGTGINSPFGYSELCTKNLAEISGLPVTLAGDLVEATQDSGEFAWLAFTRLTRRRRCGSASGRRGCFSSVTSAAGRERSPSISVRRPISISTRDLTNCWNR